MRLLQRPLAWVGNRVGHGQIELFTADALCMDTFAQLFGCPLLFLLCMRAAHANSGKAHPRIWA